MTTSTPQKLRAPRNRTVAVEEEETAALSARLLHLDRPAQLQECIDRTIHGDATAVLRFLPPQSIDLAVIDPPYNLQKTYATSQFKAMSSEDYGRLVDLWLEGVMPLLKPNASLYVCSEWRSSASIQRVLERRFHVLNRITWEREKGRGALRNWKNASEDIWFCTVGSDYYFNVDAVKSKRRVVAPYRDPAGNEKGWSTEGDGNFRLTHPSNLWTDITVPFWSMPENTDHPTQKPEKLVAKLVLASSRPGDVVLDPFLGSGTTSVVAKKLGRRYIGVEAELPYCLLAEKRLARVASDSTIQGYCDGVFLERNTLALQERQQTLNAQKVGRSDLFSDNSDE